MNEVFVRRLIGLIVLLVVLFGLSLLLPRGLQSGEDAVPSSTVPLNSVSLGATAEPLPPPAAVAQADKPEVAPSSTSVESAMTQETLRADPPVPVPPPRKPKMTEAQDKPAPKPAIPKSAPVHPSAVAAATSPRPSTAVASKSSSAKSSGSSDKREIVTPPAGTPPQRPSTPKSSTPPLIANTKPATTLPPSAPIGAPAGPVAPASSTPQSKLWFVQIGSYSDHDKAQTTASLLQNIGYRAEIGPVTGPGGSTLQRVRLGPFPSESLAQQAQARVAHQGYPDSRTVAETRSKS